MINKIFLNLNFKKNSLTVAISHNAVFNTIITATLSNKIFEHSKIIDIIIELIFVNSMKKLV